MTPTADDYREAVSNGAALLDARVPGWRERVDVADLDLANCEKCPLGQLFGEYRNGIVFLRLVEADLARAVGYGFNLPLSGHPGSDKNRARWVALRDAWVKELQR